MGPTLSLSRKPCFTTHRYASFLHTLISLSTHNRLHNLPQLTWEPRNDQAHRQPSEHGAYKHPDLSFRVHARSEREESDEEGDE
jgi:hypothetical protein